MWYITFEIFMFDVLVIDDGIEYGVLSGIFCGLCTALPSIGKLIEIKYYYRKWKMRSASAFYFLSTPFVFIQ